MADQENVLDLLGQAISCEYPHLHGAVNLNRLREVLNRLLSQKYPEFCNEQNASIPCTLASNSSEPHQTLSSVQQSNAGMENKMHSANSIALELNRSELNADVANWPSGVVTNVPSFPDDCNSQALVDQIYSQEVIAVSRKLKELQEHLNTVEAKVHEIEEAFIQTSAQCHTTHEEIPDCTSKTTVLVQCDDEPLSINSMYGEEIANFGENTTNTNGCQVRTSSSQDIVAESDIQSLGQQEVTVLGQGKSFETSSTVTRFSKETQTDNSTHDGELVDKETLNCEKGQHTSPAVAELRILVEALMEREAELCERQTQLERTTISYMEELNSRLEAKGNNDTAYPVCHDVKTNANSPFVQGESIPNLSVFPPSFQHPDPHDVAEKPNIGYFAAFESEVRSILAELRKEIHMLETKTDEPPTRLAAGGKILLEPQKKHHVKCISCDGFAIMNQLTEHVPKPMLFSTNRCLQPYLRYQLDLLKKDIKRWTNTSDILQYRRFLKKK